jgi:hypothetical protein
MTWRYAVSSLIRLAVKREGLIGERLGLKIGPLSWAANAK